MSDTYLAAQSDAAQTAPAIAPKAAYHHGDLRAQLIEAVRQLVEIHGPNDFSVAEAARLAGVSSAAPYKHFKDRTQILHAVVSEGMDRLRAAMEAGAARHPQGSLEAVAAIGQAYLDFAKSEPGVFRLMFGLTEGHDTCPDLLAKGECCYTVVHIATAARLHFSPDDPEVSRRAYMLWSFVHGHSFLTLDNKNDMTTSDAEDWDFLMSVATAILGPPAPSAARQDAP